MRFINPKTVKKVMEIAIPVITGITTVFTELEKVKKEKQFNNLVKEVAELKKKMGES